jgi:hypothetical protein
MKVCGIVEVEIHLFLTSALHTGNWPALLARSLNPQENRPWYKLNWRIVMSRSWRFEEEFSLGSKHDFWVNPAQSRGCIYIYFFFLCILLFKPSLKVVLMNHLSIGKVLISKAVQHDQLTRLTSVINSRPRFIHYLTVLLRI